MRKSKNGIDKRQGPKLSRAIQKEKNTSLEVARVTKESADPTS